MKTYIKYLCAVLMIICTSASAWGTGIYLDYNSNKYYNGQMVTINLAQTTLPAHGTPSMAVKNDAGWTQDTYSRYGIITTTLSGTHVPSKASFLAASYSASAGTPVGNDNETSYYTYNASAASWNASFQLGYYFTAAGTYDVVLTVTEKDQADAETVLQSATITIRFVVTFSGYTITYNLSGIEHASANNPIATSGAFHSVFELADNYGTPITGTYSDGFVTNEPITIGSSGDCYYNLGDLYYTSTPAGNITINLSATLACTPLAAPGSLTLSQNHDATHGKTRFGWNSVANASGYKVTVSNGVTTASVTTASDRYYYITTFPVGNYTWSVKAVGDGSTYCEENDATDGTPFCVGADLSAVTPSNLAASSVTNTTATISWDAVANAVSYNVWVMNAAEDDIIYDGSGSSTSFTATGLTAGTTYVIWWEAVNSCDGDGYNSEVDNSVSFTTTNNHTVSFNANGGGGSMDAVVRTHGTTYDLPGCTFVAPSGKVFKCWAEGSAGGTERAVGYTHTVNADITYYAKWRDAVISDYVFSCSELTLTPHLVTAGTPIFITSVANKKVRSQDYITISGSGLTPNTALTFPGLDSKFEVLTSTGGTISTDASGEIDDVNAYIFYTPAADATTDGLDKLVGLTVSVSGAKPKQVSLSQEIIGRHLPANFVIAAKFADNKWYALPANKATGNLTPVPIRVNSESTPTTAYCANTNSFTLYQDNTSNSPKVILGLTNFKTDGGVSYALFGSSSGSEVGKSTGTVSGSPGNQYKWTLAQQATSVSGVGDAKYQITVTNNAQPLAIRTYSGSTTWGLHASSGTRVTEMRLLTLQEVQPLSLKVMEWGTDAIVVSYPNGGSASGVQAAIGDASPSSVTMTSLGGDIYKISTISGLQSNPSKPLYIMATESGTSKQAVVTIPLIVTASKTEAQLRESLPGATADIRNATAKYIDVIIRNGGTMTTNSGSGNFANLYIYPGGKAIVSNNMSFDTIYMRGGYSFLDNKATYRYPDLCVKSGTMTTSGLKYDLYIDNRYYYTFSMPYDVTLASVTDEAGYDDFPVWVKHYDGEKRASGKRVTGWDWYGDEVGQGSFFAGVGYEITAKPKVSGRPIAIIRFPVKSGNITSDASREIGVSVGNYGYDDYESGSLAANNVGWNFVGNPYLTEYKAGTASPANDTLMIVAQGYVQHIDPTTGVWDGTYDWQASNKRFITVPYDTQTDYHSEYVATYTIPAFSAFFIQTETEGTFYMRGTRPQAAGVAPRYMQAQREKPEVHLDVLLHGDNEAVEAKAGLIIHDKYEGGLKDFEDVEQWFVDQNEQKTYTFASGTALAYNLTNEQAAAQVIPMGYIATVAGEHVYSISESNDVSRLAQLLLTDYETGLTTDLLVHDYVFTTEAGRFDERFAISAVLEKDEVVTEVAGTSSDSWTKTIGVYRDGNTLTLRGLPEGSSAYVYDMTGKLIASGQHLHNVASFNIAAQGVYNIRVVDGERAVTLRSVLH